MAIVVLAALGWSGWWYWHATMRERAITEWLAERRAEGWVAEVEAVQVIGFPNRIDTIVTGLHLADPEASWEWRAPEFQVLSLSYRPQHVIVAWPGEQVIATPVERIAVETTRLRGSVVFEPGLRLTLDRATIEIEGMALRGRTGWHAFIGNAVLATRRVAIDGEGFAHELGFTAETLVMPEAWTEGIDRAGMLPEAIEAVDLDAVLVFDRPWDRAAVEGENPAIERLRIADARIGWGELDLRAQGALVTDAAGFAEGEIALRARNWREMLDIAETSGALGAGMSGAVRTGLELLARFSGDPEVLELPLGFEGGRARLGPIGIGPAPRLARAAQRQ